jgi:hypothetical protein
VIAPEQLVLAVATAAFPTVTALVGILTNNQRLNDLARTVDLRFAHIGVRLADTNRQIDVRFADTNRRIDETHRHIDDGKELLRGEMFRMEQVIDARLKHLEEHLQR